MTTTNKIFVRYKSGNDSNLTRDTEFDYWTYNDIPIEVDGVKKMAESAVKSCVEDLKIKRERILVVLVHIKKNVYRFVPRIRFSGIWREKHVLEFGDVSKEK